MIDTEVSFKNTLSILNDERNKALSLAGSNMEKMMHLIDILTRRVIDVMDKPVEDVVLIGSTVEVEIDYDDFVDVLEYTIGCDISKGTIISIYGPLGSVILGQGVGSIVEYKVNEFRNRAKILSIKNEKEKQKILTNN